MALGLLERPEVVAFDIIGTTFSIEPMRVRLSGLGLPATTLEEWFASGLRDAFALAATGDFEPFTAVLEGALDQVLAHNGLMRTEKKKAEVLDGMKELPPHPDAGEAVEMLANAGFRIFALTNGSASSTQALLEGAGLDRHVERCVSVEDVKLSKPRLEIYRHAVGLAKVKADRLMLVASHAWDIHGAKAAGLSAAYVSRSIPFPSAVMNKPDIEGISLGDVARRLVAL